MPYRGRRCSLLLLLLQVAAAAAVDSLQSEAGVYSRVIPLEIKDQPEEGDSPHFSLAE